MNKGYKTIHWGILLLAFNFYLGSINIFPDILGFILISKGLSEVICESYEGYFHKAKRISNIMIGISLIEYILSMNMDGRTINFTTKGIILFTASNFIGLITLAMVYYILKGIYIEAESKGLQDYMGTINKSWNNKLVISLVNLLLCAFVINESDFALGITTLVAIIGVIVEVWVAMVVKRAYSEFS